MTVKSRKYLAGLMILLCGLWLSATALQGSDTAHAQSTQRVTVQLNWKHQNEFAAFYAALNQGYYHDAGLDVVIQEGGPGIDAVKEVVEGRAEFGVGTSALIVDRYRGMPVVVLATLMQHSPIGLLALRRNGIESVHDLANRAVAVDPHSRDEIEAYLRASGIPAGNLQLVDQVDWTLDSLHKGLVAAKTVYISNEPFLIHGKEHEYLLLTPRSAGIDLFGNMLFCTESTIRNHPETVKEFREATLKGLTYALDHPQEITELILARYNTQHKSPEHLLFELAQIRELTRHDIVEPGYMSAGRWRHVIEIYASQGKLPADFDLQDFIYASTSPGVPVWLVWTLTGSLAGLLAALTLLLKFRRLNSLLRKEITVRKQADERIHTLSQAIEQSPVSIMIADTEANIQYVNSAFEQTTGYSAVEMIGLNTRDSKPVEALQGLFKVLKHAKETGRGWQGELQGRRKNGEVLWERVHLAPVFDASEHLSHYLAVIEDITTHKRQEQRILHQAHFDSLTNLPNRFLCLDRLAQMIKEAHRTGRRAALLFLDLDDFKKVNDTLGHEVGDELLIQAAERLRNAVRDADTIGRLGGDEFVLIVGGLTELSDAYLVAEKLLVLFRTPFRLGSRELVITVSLGIAIYPDDGDSPAELLRNADTAMYHSKEQGRNTYHSFTNNMNQGVSRRLALEEQLHGALENHELSLCYQPLVDIDNHSMIGAEALLRWHNPVLGAVSPAEFIPVAEQTGLIVPIGQYVLNQALEMTAKWHEQSDRNFKIAINISPRQFFDTDLLKYIEQALQQSGVPTESLELEITEGVLMSGNIQIAQTLAGLKALGVIISMDDFGTGYSSLSYLRRYPFDILKIDRSFVQDITADRADRELVNAIIAMAHGLGLKVVAEGVEQEEQLAFLAAQGCDMAQGYIFSQPVPPEEITTMLETPDFQLHPQKISALRFSN